MAAIDDAFNTNQITVWRLTGRDMNNSPSYNMLGVFGATWNAGSSVKRDAAGVEFVPKDVYYMDDDADVRRGDLIERGDRSGSLTPVGDVVRSTDRYDNSFFGWDDSFVVMTE